MHLVGYFIRGAQIFVNIFKQPATGPSTEPFEPVSLRSILVFLSYQCWRFKWLLGRNERKTKWYL
jgi:hypothetical protein